MKLFSVKTNRTEYSVVADDFQKAKEKVMAYLDKLGDGIDKTIAQITLLADEEPYYTSTIYFDEFSIKRLII